MRGPAFFAYADNYLVDVKVGLIVDVEASRARQQAQFGDMEARRLRRLQRRPGVMGQFECGRLEGLADVVNCAYCLQHDRS
jgi:hypothetical protein